VVGKIDSEGWKNPVERFQCLEEGGAFTLRWFPNIGKRYPKTSGPWDYEKNTT
jgi:hypothetical protein